LIVLDASAAVDYLLDIGASRLIASRIGTAGETLHAPHVLDLEVGQALRRLALRRILSPGRAEDALADYAGLRLRRYPHGYLLPRIWELRANLTVFDAAYVALAEVLESPLITADARLARSAGHEATIELFREPS
jgi:predicted nucleic acid-binding protein